MGPLREWEKTHKTLHPSFVAVACLQRPLFTLLAAAAALYVKNKSNLLSFEFILFSSVVFKFSINYSQANSVIDRKHEPKPSHH
jgi:hypothetical protein